VVSNFSFGSIFFLLSIPAIALIILSISLHAGMTVIVACIAVAAVYLVVLSLIHSALQAIFQTALYLYAQNGQVPDGFRSNVLENALGR
jgi:hypothetical protein